MHWRATRRGARLAETHANKGVPAAAVRACARIIGLLLWLYVSCVVDGPPSADWQGCSPTFGGV
jgi:hypothetical protein